jgi:Protein of unknown function (DUF3143)
MIPITLPPSDTPIYNHPLPQIEQWLANLGCEQDRTDLHLWRVEYPNWQAEIWLDIEELNVRYLRAGEDGQDIKRSFKYSLSRKDMEAVVFAGP